ncbi:TetR family transcriptional regulator [Mycobacterium sp. UM_CSW]|uniref:TetR family transcriptional regulator n=1 Tax=Mycobacterium sp. UM_CSW TaxID=1370119 RepID=UPI001EF9F7AB|nr:TetR family transcriptional regulator [Mycobacterium sp. UM_CSW]
MTSSLSTRSERTRDAIVTAALARFLNQGVAATTVADIVADAGLGERTFYRYFPSKEHVLFSDYDDRLDWFRAALRVRPPREPITVSVRAAVESFPYNDALQQIAHLRTRELAADIISAHTMRLQASFADEIEAHLRRRTPTADADDTTILLRDRLHAQMISAAMFTALNIWLATADGDFDELERLIDIALRTIADGIQ